MVQPDQLVDAVDGVVRVSQRAEALSGHFGTHDFVVVKRNAFWPNTAGPRLPDVMQHRGEPKLEVVGWPRALDHGQRVSEDIFMLMDWVLLQLEGGQLGEYQLEEAGSVGELQSVAGGRPGNEL
jgi:hypothetical protein